MIMRRFFKGEITKEEARVQLESIWRLGTSRSTTPEGKATVTPRGFNERMQHDIEQRMRLKIQQEAMASEEFSFRPPEDLEGTPEVEVVPSPQIKNWRQANNTPKANEYSSCKDVKCNFEDFYQRQLEMQKNTARKLKHLQQVQQKEYMKPSLTPIPRAKTRSRSMTGL